MVDEMIKRGVPLVVDADGLWLIANNPTLISSLSSSSSEIILTPNKRELEIMENLILNSSYSSTSSSYESHQQLADHLNSTLLIKGETDLVFTPSASSFYEIHQRSSPRRF